MDEDEIFPVLCPKKTYSKPFKKVARTVTESNNMEKSSSPYDKSYEPGVPLTTKVAVEYLLNGKLKTCVCRYCLKVTVGLSDLDQIMQIAGTGVLYKVSIREMIACFYPFKTREGDNFPEKICQKCLDRAINAYLFTQQCEQADRALHNCFDDIEEKFNKLDPLERPKKRGRQKLHPNYNKLNVEHSKVIDYAEPIRNIINLQTESLTNEPYWNDFECKKCWEVLPDLESLLNHEQIHPKYMWYNCRLCGKSFVKLNQLKKHFNNVHVTGKEVTEAVDKTFKCLECGNVTENYAHHLQHVEKHKFKSVMKHLIEKKTDQLCLVCLNKCTDLVELDKMVCIHGNCPELVGDKTLYTVLASTLPDRKSYKYQELHVPHKADKMTITQRKRKHAEIENVPHIIPGMRFVLSLPKIISRDKFKTDDFYYYVFCEPQAEDYIISTIDKNIDTHNIKSRRISEVTDEETMDCNFGDILNDDYAKNVFGDFNDDPIMNTKATITVVGKYNPVTEGVIDETDLFKSSNYRNQIEVNANPGVRNATGQIESVGLIIKGYATSMIVPDDEQNVGLIHDERNFCNVKETMDVVRPENDIKEETEIFEKDTIVIPDEYPTDTIKKEVNTSSFKDPQISMFQFSKPITMEFDLNKHNTDMTSTFQFCNPDYDEKINLEMNSEEKISEHEIVPMKVKTALSSIFTRTADKLDLFIENKDTEIVTEVMTKPKIKDNDCKFCWLFKHSTKCEKCKKPIDKDEITDENKQIIKSTVIDNTTKNNTEKLIDTTAFYKENVELLTKSIKLEKKNKDRQIEQIWQCNVCLTTNNKARSTCHCCESKKYIENTDCKVTFGNMKTFFTPTHAAENIKESNNEKKTDISIKNSNPFVIIDEETMMDTKWTVQDNIKTQIGNMKDKNLTQSMDMDTDSANYIFDNKHPINEDMDVEEEPFTFNSAQEFDPIPTANFASYFGTNIGANLQFNIGSNSSQKGHEKGPRKFVKAVRKMPKAFHK